MDTANSSVQPEGKRIKVQQVKAGGNKLNTRSLLAQLCYYYPQYTLSDAAKIPYRDVQLLLREAQKQMALHYYNLTQIAAAPQTKKGEGVRKLSKHFKEIASK